MKADIEARLAELREAIESARSMPMSASAVVNRADFLDLVARLEETIDTSLTEASAVVVDRDAVVASGQDAAEEILREARERREQLVSDTDVYRLAQKRAEEIETEAQRHASELRAETDHYVEERLANFELTLERTLDAVKRGRAKLSGGHVHGLADDSDVADIALPDHLER